MVGVVTRLGLEEEGNTTINTTNTTTTTLLPTILGIKTQSKSELFCQGQLRLLCAHAHSVLLFLIVCRLLFLCYKLYTSSAKILKFCAAPPNPPHPLVLSTTSSMQASAREASTPSANAAAFYPHLLQLKMFLSWPFMSVCWWRILTCCSIVLGPGVHRCTER